MHPFQAIDADCTVKPDGQNSVISKWLLPELSFSDRWSRKRRNEGANTLERRPWNEIGLDLVLLTTLPLREGGGVEAVAA